MVGPVKAIAVIIVLAAPFYAWSVYESFFEERPGYIYDPATDNLYWLKLGPAIYRGVGWKRHILPFNSFQFSDIRGVDREATLADELAEQNRPFSLEQFRQERQERMEARESTIEDVEFVSAEYWVRRDLDALQLLPPQWRNLPDHLGEDFRSSVLPADVVIARTSRGSKGPIHFEILRGVLVLRDAAGYALNSHCFHSSQLRWEECGHVE